MAGGHLNRKLESESVSPPILDLEGGGEGELKSEEGQAVRLKVVGKPPSLKNSKSVCPLTSHSEIGVATVSVAGVSLTSTGNT